MSPPPGPSPCSPPELWAGVECSVVRVGDEYHDQLERSGHVARVDDLDRVAGLGIRALRYPVLWERTAPDGLERADWGWPDERLGRLRALGVRPIVGLVHHGSGPPGTSLVESSFAAGLAGFAGAVAARYPWVDDYTPVNEPLTTARFSGLYGHWYPHGRDDRTFARALLNQCHAVVLAMRAIRAVNPHARLVQTDDLGLTHSTPGLAYQADFENERRWLAFDLLRGRVAADHPLRPYLLGAGIADRELGWFLDNPCPPDVIGLNHYLTSERFLDDRLDHYPADRRGGNGREGYADVEAVRVRAAGTAGPGAMLREAWERYRLPLAITEVHLGCTREEQMRWFLEVWDAARAARREGIDVLAVTAWAAFGSFDWDSLMMKRAGRYEPGAFDLRSPHPRPTALASLLQGLARGDSPAHPVLDAPGWWRRPGRLLHPPVGRAPEVPGGEDRVSAGTSRPLAILGAGGPLGRAFAEICTSRGLFHHFVLCHDADLNDEVSVAAHLDELRPWAVVNAAGSTRAANIDGAVTLAAACARRGLALLGFSSDLVFGGDGDRDTPYRESDPVHPLDVFGRSKVEMEARILDVLPAALIVRAGPLFGPWDGIHFIAPALRDPDDGPPSVVADDVVVSPTYIPDMVHAALDLLIDGERGLWHLANAGAITWAGLARRAAELAGLDPSSVVGLPDAISGRSARRPAYRALHSERGAFMPTLEDALHRSIREAGVSTPPQDIPSLTGGGLAGCPEGILANISSAPR